MAIGLLVAISRRGPGAARESSCSSCTELLSGIRLLLRGTPIHQQQGCESDEHEPHYSVDPASHTRLDRKHPSAPGYRRIARFSPPTEGGRSAAARPGLSSGHYFGCWRRPPGSTYGLAGRKWNFLFREDNCFRNLLIIQETSPNISLFYSCRITLYVRIDERSFSLACNARPTPHSLTAAPIRH
jgi:hypothetical protein